MVEFRDTDPRPLPTCPECGATGGAGRHRFGCSERVAEAHNRGEDVTRVALESAAVRLQIGPCAACGFVTTYALTRGRHLLACFSCGASTGTIVIGAEAHSSGEDVTRVEARARHVAYNEIPDLPTSPQDERERAMKRRAFVAGYVRAYYLERR